LLPAVLFVAGLPLFGQGTPGATRESVAKELDEIGRIAAVMVDGDVCQRIMTRRSLEQMFVQNPKDPWAASDNFQVHHEPYIQVKKTLIRLSRRVPFACDVNLWMPFREKPDKIQVLIRNVNEWSQFWTWGALTQDMPIEMKRVLETGTRERVTRRPGMISVLAPVYNSLGDIVALVEVVARRTTNDERRTTDDKRNWEDRSDDVRAEGFK
jgi:hypothetical protein